MLGSMMFKTVYIIEIVSVLSGCFRHHNVNVARAS